MTTIRLPLDSGHLLLRRPRATGALAGALGRVGDAAIFLAGWPGRVMEARRTMRLLGAMDDHELADIGLARSDLRDATSLAIDEDPSHLLARRARARARRCV